MQGMQVRGPLTNRQLQLVGRSNKALSATSAMQLKSGTAAGRPSRYLGWTAAGWMAAVYFASTRLLLGRQLPDALLVLVKRVPSLLFRQQVRALLSVHKRRHESVANPWIGLSKAGLQR